MCSVAVRKATAAILDGERIETPGAATSMRRARSAVAALGLCALLGASVTGCGDYGGPTEPSASVPAPSSPDGLMRSLEWAYNNRSLEAYRALLAADFGFNCASLDSAGNAWRGTPWTREDELGFAVHLFVGGGGQPPPSSIRLSLGKNVFAFPDPTYPWDATGRWHKATRTTLTLMLTTTSGESLEVFAHQSFFLVRGDSARVTGGVQSPGGGLDSTRWYIRRWEDDSAEEDSSLNTLCGVKAIYR